MKIGKLVVILVLIYIGIVVAFESLLGYFQPAGQTTLVITTTDEDGDRNERVLSALDDGGQLFVAANHWPRAWYNQALENPNVEITLRGETGSFLAVPLTGAEFDRINAETKLGPVIRILTGFPPRRIVRLDPL